ncbi:hypothetical protein HZB60_02525 [candidate division KSB1 bacterium]|nr:hypothetical protein [candidate division KSB1 bacterium]
MFYKDLIPKTAALAAGRHVIYALNDGRVEIRNVGRRHHSLAAQPEFRLHLHFDQRELTPRHSDFFSDFLLKIETRHELRLALTETCELVCNGSDPIESAQHHKLPAYFAEWGEGTWSFQMGMYQTGGLPTEVFLCGLQTLIRVYQLNDPTRNWPELYRVGFVNLEKGQPLLDVVRSLAPIVRPGKRYFDRQERKLA